jgi:hypothetical protein
LNQVLVGKSRSSDPPGGLLAKLFGRSQALDPAAQVDLGEFIDALFKGVQLILDMPMPKLRVEIQIHEDQKDVAEIFTQLTGEHSDAPSFYWKRTNTIHIQPENLTVGMLAHEMGHAIMDHFFAIQPPPKIREMLCQYVDREVSGNSDQGMTVSHAR